MAVATQAGGGWVGRVVNGSRRSVFLAGHTVVVVLILEHRDRVVALLQRRRPAGPYHISRIKVFILNASSNASEVTRLLQSVLIM